MIGLLHRIWLTFGLSLHEFNLYDSGRKAEAAGGDGYAVEISGGQRRLLAATVAEWTLALMHRWRAMGINTFSVLQSTMVLPRR